ncbi:MAG: hypothetical protein AAGB46_04655 [Verrucomicrobiota bacterium]
MKQNTKRVILFLTLVSSSAFAADESVSARLTALMEQNQRLLSLAQEQQQQIDELRSRLNSLDEADQRQKLEINEIRDDVATVADSGPASSTHSNRFRLSGEVGLAYFSGEQNGQFANEEFRVGESRVFLEAEVARDTYLFTAIELFRRESGNSDVEVGEVFVDFENVFGLNLDDGLATARVGRFQIPFGQEYLNRYVFENPMVSHSVADIMGIDEGVQVFGEADGFSYALAIMNGGAPSLRDFDSSKALVARMGYQPAEKVNFHASFMNTGDINVAGDGATELWIGDTRFRSIGSAGTSEFDVELFQLDGSFGWRGGIVKTAIGSARYEDNDPLGSNLRDIDFFQVEALQNLTPELYAVLRYSQLEADGGYLIAGNGDPAIFIGSGILTEELERLSLGLGYLPAENVIAKLEYSFEEGSQSDGSEREDTDQLSAELGVRF